jgi:hypothetical protein
MTAGNHGCALRLEHYRRARVSARQDDAYLFVASVAAAQMLVANLARTSWNDRPFSAAAVTCRQVVPL